jgi:hypothetical protein
MSDDLEFGYVIAFESYFTCDIKSNFVDGKEISKALSLNKLIVNRT